jgi:mono/diheme cytochrome c family protein
MKLSPSLAVRSTAPPAVPKRSPLRTALSLLAALLLLAPVAHADAKKAERMWKSKCQSCHGKDGKGQTDKGKKMQVKDLSAAAWQAKVTDDELKKAIKEGTKTEKDGVKKEMDAYADLTDEQLADLIAYVRALKP